ncbi:uncharacterized protein LOC110239801 [Exaiptasia diaphana]|uniref:COX assembly mitochondrial protein n=1 Tax=Exaiptasia diaphana TaxID=2652724 RepID=A0A913X9M1_EXADI|nr:uncharacterized protein LOC110239801 [Exaiptasia diaphana]KXJ20603.1 hypothetical protein AC249_AIPGENE9430 [Exaiptasia diaphana]
MDALDELFKIGKEPKTEKEMILAYIKVQALEVCEDSHNELIKCYQKRWFPDCNKQQRDFWKCYEETSIKLRKRHAVY